MSPPRKTKVKTKTVKVTRKKKKKSTDMDGFVESLGSRSQRTDEPCLNSYKTGLFSLNAVAREMVQEEEWTNVKIFVNGPQKKMLIVPTDEDSDRKVQIKCQFSDMAARQAMQVGDEIVRLTEIEVMKTKYGRGLVVKY